MHSTLSSRQAQSSPSVSMEKGAYRLHAPPPRKSVSKRQRGEYAETTFSAQEKRMGLIILLLVIATLSCFGSAYYLFITRWARNVFPVKPSVSDDHEHLQVVAFEPSHPQQEFEYPTSNYLSYLPHSGFHNQRIAFENALMLARILNRTLLVPPVRLGKGVIHYASYDELRHTLALSGKDRTFHCRELPLQLPPPSDCSDYFNYTLVSWDWLVDLSSVRLEQPLIERWDMSDDWLRRRLNVSKSETFSLKDSSLYHFRFVDSYSTEGLGPRYLESISISQLNQISHRLLQVGTLFGSSRLRLRDAQNIVIRKQIRQSMVFSNKVLIEAANSIQARLGGTYLSAHVRLGDGRFQASGRDNVRLIWWKLVQEKLGLGEDDALDLEARFTNNSAIKDLHASLNHTGLHGTQPLSLYHSSQTSESSLLCHGTRYTEPRFTPLNNPLFISTDVREAFSHPLLRVFYETFPCTFVLYDFPIELALLDRLRSEYDGLMLKDFALPFLDAVVAGKANVMVGTEGSTFSQFVEDVLWRQYHGWEIFQRG